MQEHDRNILWLIALGVAIAIGKLLTGSEPLSWRLVAGRSLLGAATTMIAGAAVMQIPDLPLIAILGLGAALGVGGAQVVEKILVGWSSRGGG
ncbi:MAG TPA: holin [Tahibacter sp.]|nr:holin [Tahibacter sp.]